MKPGELFEFVKQAGKISTLSKGFGKRYMGKVKVVRSARERELSRLIRKQRVDMPLDIPKDVAKRYGV